jgi:hypothetical protein
MDGWMISFTLTLASELFLSHHSKFWAQPHAERPESQDSSVTDDYAMYPDKDQLAYNSSSCTNFIKATALLTEALSLTIHPQYKLSAEAFTYKT